MMKNASTITNIGYINVPITLPLILACFSNKFLIRSNVFSSSPDSSPAFTRPIKIYPKTCGYLAIVSAKVEPAIICVFKIFDMSRIFFLAASCSINIKDSTAGIPDVNKICRVEIKSIFSLNESDESLVAFLAFISTASFICVGTSPILRTTSRASLRLEAVISPLTTSFPCFNAM